jgi:hypothetical protein
MSALQGGPEITGIVLEMTNVTDVGQVDSLGNSPNHRFVFSHPVELSFDNVFGSSNDIPDVRVLKVYLHNPAPVLVVGVRTRGLQLFDGACLQGRVS